MLLALAMCVFGCSAKSTRTVNGRVLLHGAPYEMGTILIVRVADVSAHPARQLAEQRQSLDPGWEAPSTHPPRDFKVSYDPAGVVASDTYVVWAEARHDDVVIAASTPVPVLTRGKETSGVLLGLASVDQSIPSTLPLP